MWCYKGFKAYQPANAYWFEQDVFLHSQFRDGNVPAKSQLLWVFKDALAILPCGVTRVFLRSDTAGYTHDLLSYCNEGKKNRFGQITFAIGAEVCDAFKKAVREVDETSWRTLFRTVNGKEKETGQQWAEVCYVPTWMATSKKSPTYRFLALREPIKQLTIPGTESMSDAPFPTYTDEKGLPYKLWGVVTNWDYDDKTGDEVIWWYRERCGHSEKAHFVQKHELAGGRLPSDKFGANAAWWQIMVLAYNLNSLMKRLVLEPIEQGWSSKYLKALRFQLINLPVRVYERSPELFIKISSDPAVQNLQLKARQRMISLANAPPIEGTC
ncbi:transposase [bacterium]|nr:transposase [bacterium]